MTNAGNETGLREQIIKALKSNRQVKVVEDNHGFQEYGIDIVFDYPDVFGQDRKYGIQVKKGDINSDNVQKILGQLCVAFGHRFSMYPDKFLDAVFVVTDGEIKNKEYLKTANIGFRNVYWIDGDRLAPLLKDSELKNEELTNITKQQ